MCATVKLLFLLFALALTVYIYVNFLRVAACYYCYVSTAANDSCLFNKDYLLTYLDQDMDHLVEGKEAWWVGWSELAASTGISHAVGKIVAQVSVALCHLPCPSQCIIVVSDKQELRTKCHTRYSY